MARGFIEAFFDDLNECTLDSFVRNYEAEMEQEEERRRLEKAEVELEVYKNLYHKWQYKYMRLVKVLKERGIEVGSI